MPETYFDIRWPDGREQSCYSPSSVIQDFLVPERAYALEDFVRLSERALTLASERVKQKYGYYCSSAADQLNRIQTHAQQFNADDSVMILRIRQ